MIKLNSKEIKSKLIEIFAKHTTDEIDNYPEIIKQTFCTNSRVDILESSDYRKYFKVIRNCKKNIQEIIKFNKEEQLYRCLNYLKSLVETNSIEIGIADELIRGSVYREWSKGDRESYNEVLEMMTKWNDVFLSYLKKEKYAQRVNLSYRKLIKETGYEEQYKAKGDSINFLAEFIAEKLQERLIVFYDREIIDYGDHLKNIIANNCATSFALVQLVQREQFILDEEKNWCYKEYCEFKDYTAFKKWGDFSDFPRLYFMLDSEEVKNIEYLKEISKNPILYEDWCDDINNYLHFKIEPCKSKGAMITYKNKLNNEIDELIKKIIETKKEIISKVLDTILYGNFEDGNLYN